MIEGGFDGDGLPFVRARLYVGPRGHWADIRLVLDLAAHSSVITPRDFGPLGIDIAGLPPAEDLGVAGRPERGWIRDAFLLLAADDLTYRFEVSLIVAAPELGARRSVLGQDLLSRCVLVHDPRDGVLSLDVLDSDGEFQTSTA